MELMNYSYLIITKKWVVILSIFLLQGCVSQIEPVKESAKTWIGFPIKDIKEIITRPRSYASSIGWQEKTYILANGNSVYVEPVRPD